MKLKYSLIIVLSLLTTGMIISHEMLSYLVVQGYGQFNILFSAKPVNFYLNDPDFPEEKKKKLLLIKELKEFAVVELGLNDTGSYEKMFDQQNKPILWLVKASPEFSLSPYRWRFPIAGSFSYLSFFDRKHADKEAEKLKQNGYDTWISEVSAWSTLGYFKDPILSSMLNRSEGSLANLIFHEMTHGTVFIKDDMKFNESLATFIGDTASVYYLEKKYGENSDEVNTYKERFLDSELLNKHLLNGAQKLKDLYDSYSDSMPYNDKVNMKKKLIADLMIEASELPYYNKDRFTNYKDFRPNNAWFSGFLTYNDEVSTMDLEFKEKFNSNYKEMISYYKSKYNQ
jgi:predicted aminopeptidase